MVTSSPPVATPCRHMTAWCTQELRHLLCVYVIFATVSCVSPDPLFENDSVLVQETSELVPQVQQLDMQSEAHAEEVLEMVQKSKTAAGSIRS